MTEHCPGCAGPYIPDDPLLLAAYAHEPRCPIARAEAETLAADLRRPRRRYRAATEAERALLRAAGAGLPPRAPVFAAITWLTEPRRRRRTWTGTYLADEVMVCE